MGSGCSSNKKNKQVTSKVVPEAGFSEANTSPTPENETAKPTPELNQNEHSKIISINLDASQVTYVTDVEGHWHYFCNYVDSTHGKLRFCKQSHSRNARTAEDLELELKDGWHFVFGGDCGDKGPGTLRFMEAMVRLKRKYPDRVHLLLGNRDIHKMHVTSSLDLAEVDRMLAAPAPYWVPEQCRITPRQYLTKLAAEEEKIEQSSVTEQMLQQRATKANKLRHILDTEVACPGDFEFRRQELAHLSSVETSQIKDDDVVESWERSLKPGGWFFEYLHLAQLGIILGDALFVHGQIIGNHYSKAEVPLADEGGIAWSIRVVPDRTEPVENVREWVAELNAWSQKEISAWASSPSWVRPPTGSTYEDWQGRAGADIVAYCTPTTRVPTVVYCRFLEKSCMPLRYPDDLVQYLQSQQIRFVVVGHTPHGNSPTVVPCGGVDIVMGDTSFSHMKANLHYDGDNRGDANSEVSLQNGMCTVKGITEDDLTIDFQVAPDGGDELIGKVCQEAKLSYFVKACLPPSVKTGTAGYLMCNIQGFRYQYAVLETEQVVETLADDNLRFGKGTRNTFCCGEKDLFGHGPLPDTELLREIFKAVDMNVDGALEKKEVLTACTQPWVRSALMSLFPSINFEELINNFDTDADGKITLAEFDQAFCKSKMARSYSGICFEIVQDEHPLGLFEFPIGHQNCKVMPTKALLPTDLKLSAARDYRSSGREDRETTRVWRCELDPAALRSPALQQLREKLPLGGNLLLGCLSPMSVIASAPFLDFVVVPEGAVYFAWSYAFEADFGAALQADAEQDPDMVFLSHGGFVYFSTEFTVLGLHAVMFDGSGGLRFGPPKPCPRELTEKLVREDRVRPVTLRNLLSKGATDFCWIMPGEECKSSDATFCYNLGAFAYFGQNLSLAS